MMAATPTKLSSEADVGRSKAQHVVILAFCSKIAGITYSASPNTALDPRLGAKTGLNDEVFVNKLTASVPNGKCQLKFIAAMPTAGAACKRDRPAHSFFWFERG